jgi:hypothetical protein
MRLYFWFAAVLVVAPGVAAADKPSNPFLEPLRYDAFDLAALQLHLKPSKADGIKEITIAANGLQPCPIDKDNFLVPSGCAVFHQPAPTDLTITVTFTASNMESWSGNILFDGGLRTSGVSYEHGAVNLTHISDAQPIHVALFEHSQFKWVEYPLSSPFQLKVDDYRGVIYAKVGGLIVGIPYGSRYPKLPDAFDCDSDLKRSKSKFESIYRDFTITSLPICVDQATPDGVALITLNKHNYIRPNNEQVVIVRHWNDVAPFLTYSGTGVGLTAPTLDGKSTSEAYKGPLQGRSVLYEDANGFTVSIFLLAPHSPGHSHFDVAFVGVPSPALVSDSRQEKDAKTEGKDKAEGSVSQDKSNKDPKGAQASDKSSDADASSAPMATNTGVDIITDAAYAGSLRFGIGYAPGAKSYRYAKATPAGATQSEIARYENHPLDVVVGYSFYLDDLSQGRTYNVIDTEWYSYFARHLGLYAGLGVIGYDGARLDYLRSMYIGGEFEVNRNFSIALTGNLRREDRLATSMVGGPVPDSGIALQSKYGWNCAFVFSISNEWFQFAKSGVSK